MMRSSLHTQAVRTVVCECVFINHLCLYGDIAHLCITDQCVPALECRVTYVYVLAGVLQVLG